MLKIVVSTFSFFILFSVFQQPASSHANDRCLKLKPVENDAVAYKERGENRCEGFYQSSVSEGSLELVGLMSGTLDFQTGQNNILRIYSIGVRKQEVHVQAVAIPMKTYYRLDGWLQPGESFAWPLEIVRKMRLRPDSVGLLGMIGDNSEIYVPLSLYSRPARNAPLNLTLRASVDVDAVQWRTGDLLGFQCGNMAKNGWRTIKPHGGDRFYSGEPIRFNPGTRKTDFCIEFAAQTSGSGSRLQQLVKVRIED